jgi:putative ABC transport system permease protein
MKTTLMKDTFRQIKKSFGRFLSIFLIVALGVGFFAGIKATSPDMKLTADKYFDDHNLMDIRLISTIGFDEKDIEAIEKVPEVESISPGYSVDLLAEYEGNYTVVKLLSLPMDKIESNDKSYINQVILVEGRFPEKPGEILAESGNGINPTFPIGSKIKFSTGTDEDISDVLKRDEYVVVGLVNTPYYISFERGTTNIGTGTISCFLMLPEDEFSLPVYTDVYVTVEGARNVNTYHEEYDDILDPVKEKLQDVGEIRADERYKEIVDEANEELNKGKEELKEAEEKLQAELEKAEKDLEQARKKLEDGERELLANEKKFRAQIEDGERRLKEEEKKLQDAEVEYERNLKLFNEKKSEALKEIEIAEVEIARGEEEIKSKQEQIDRLKESLNFIEDEQEKIRTIQIIEYGEQELKKAREEIEAAKLQLEWSKQELIENEKKLEAARMAIEEGKQRIKEEWNKLEVNKQKALLEFDKARRELAKGREEYEKGYAEYLKSKDEGLREIEKAKEEIAEQEEKLKELEKPKWYVLKRTETLDYIDFGMNADRIDAVASVFPVFFLAVAVLVSLTTMTRMVDEERSHIGTLKALGYGKMDIASKYLIYAALASIGGSIVGLLIGFRVLPTVIFNAYRIMYIMPEVITQFNFTYAFISSTVAVFATLIAAWVAIRGELKETPALLLRPKTPKPGKRIFLENITFIWSRMKFTHKVTARNIFRYKKRFIMTVLGISGCTALLLTGFGLKDSIISIVGKQFDELYKYQLAIEVKGNDKEGMRDVIEFINRDNGITDYILINEKSIDIGKGNIEKTVNFIVPENSNKLQDFITLRERKSQKAIPLTDDGVVLSEKMAKLLDVNVGDKIYIKDEDDNKLYVKVTGITENYANHFMYMSRNLYEKVFGKEVDYQRILCKTSSTDKEFEDRLSERLLKIDNISSVSFTTGVSDNFNETLGSLNYVIMVIIMAAGALAFVVLYNLTNINIGERYREIATIKVLGFYDNEVANYIYRENFILTIIGTALGLILGIFLHRYVIVTTELEIIMFGREIKPISFVYSAALTLLFSVLVSIAMYYRLKKIDMVASLKSVD